MAPSARVQGLAWANALGRAVDGMGVSWKGDCPFQQLRGNLLFALAKEKEGKPSSPEKALHFLSPYWNRILRSHSKTLDQT